MEKELSIQNLNNELTSVLMKLEPSSQTLLVCFGGIKGELPIPVFEFLNSLDKYTINKIFLRDFRQVWYHQGLLNISSNSEETLSYLKKKITEINAKRVIFLGNSSGGYAAILYGCLLNVNHVLAFSPQTFVNKLTRFFKRDQRWQSQISTMYDIKNLDKKILNLCDLLNSTKYNTTVNIYYGKNNKLDSKHAMFLRKCNNINLFPKEGDSHNIIKDMRDDGSLFKEIERYVI